MYTYKMINVNRVQHAIMGELFLNLNYIYTGKYIRTTVLDTQQEYHKRTRNFKYNEIKLRTPLHENNLAFLLGKNLIQSSRVIIIIAVVVNY